MGIRAGFSFGERQIFVGNRLAARTLDYSGAGGGGKVPCRITRCCEEQRCVLAWQFSSSVSRYRRLHGPSLTTPEFRDIYKEDIASGRVGRCDQRRTAMNGYPPRKPQSARRVAFRKWAFVGAIAGASYLRVSSVLPGAQRMSTRRLRPSTQPSCCMLCSNANSRLRDSGSLSGGGHEHAKAPPAARLLRARMPTQRSDDIMLHALAVLRFMNEFVPCTG